MDGGMKSLNYVSESVLKKRRIREQSAIQRAGQHQDRGQRKKDGVRSLIKRPEEFVKEFRHKELDLIKMRTRLTVQKMKRTAAESKLLFVIRINGSNAMHPLTRKILRRLRLDHIFTGVFLISNEAILNMLVKVEPYVTYGYPNLRSVRELIFKKACGRVKGTHTPLTDNNIIERALGKHGILCIEDIVHEIESVGPHFKEVNHFLLPFKLKKPGVKVMQESKKVFRYGGDVGDRGDQINDLISKLN